MAKSRKIEVVSDDKCECGHMVYEHWKEGMWNGPLCWECAVAGTWKCTGFKLDNLEYCRKMEEERKKK